tara:strand:- start:4735 stop:6978 length:2244 start_codon:yes stop_codon:yes gene_type:complete
MIKIILCLIIASFSFSQIQSEGTPKYYNNDPSNGINFLTLENNPRVDREFHPMVFQFGIEYDVDINLLDEAQVYIDNNIYTFILGISSEDAYGMGFSFDHFFLSENAELYFYDRERTRFLGALTNMNNKSTNSLTTSVVKGENIIIELSVPQEEIKDIRLNIDTIIHDQADIMNYYNTIDSDREDCNINVICSEGDEWRDQINGVVRVSMGGGLCSASIINNTSNDRTPYVLFADHCVSGSASGYVFYFNYQSASCSGNSGPTNQTVSGSTLLASEDINSGPDFALLRLTSDIPDSYDPFYVGWSRSSFAPQEAVGIHHPGGDIKKISFTNDNVSAGGTGGYYWEFQYDEGRVIPGSSGSPFFDQNKRQVGIASYIYTNYCDPSPDCYCAQQYNHGYGRFDSAWNMGLSQYLDPINSGQTAIDGIGISGIDIAHSEYENIPFESNTLNFSAEVNALTGNIDAVELYYDFGDGWNSAEMQSSFNSDLYQIDINGIVDGMLIRYYIQAVNSEGLVQTYPNNAPDNYILFTIGELDAVLEQNFESNDDINNWNLSGNSDWYITSENSNSGSSSFRSGEITDNQQSTASIILDIERLSIVEFSYRVSSEYSPSGDYFYDGLSLYIDEQLTGQYQPNENGESPWVDLSFILEPGEHTLRLTYSKDAGGGSTDCVNTNCEDAGFIDDFIIYSYIDVLPGDLNFDTTLNVLDVIILVNMVLGFENPDYSAGDINSDSVINILDVVSLVSLILDI